MVYSDPETRVGAHRIFAVVLVPSSVCPRPCPATPYSTKKNDIQRTLSRTVSVFSSSAALLKKLKKEQSGLQDKTLGEDKTKIHNPTIFNRLNSTCSQTYNVKRNPSTRTTGDLLGNEGANINNPSLLNRLKSTYSKSYSVKRHPATTSTTDVNSIGTSGKDTV